MNQGIPRANRNRYSRSRLADTHALFLKRISRIVGMPARGVPAVLTNPAFKVVRLNGLRFDATASLAGKGVEAEAALKQARITCWPLAWFPGAWVFDAAETAAVQALPFVQDGKLFIQNPSSYLPALALEAGPSMRVLDMCSAPGGKAALIAALTRNQAELAVNEPKPVRAEKLREVLEMLGVRVSAAYAHDGRELPEILGTEGFDRVLVDADCSTEASINFKSRDPLHGWSPERITALSVQQKQLIVAAYDLLKPGGILVYSTCTFAPEENEAVVASLLERRPGAVVQPLAFRAERTIRRIKSWEGKAFPEAVVNGCLRIFPGEYMEGFFVARIRKPAGGSAALALTKPVSLDTLARQAEL